MFPDKLEQSLITVEPKTRAAVKAAFVKAAKDLGKQIKAHNPPQFADRVQTSLEEQFVEIATRLAPELQGRRGSK